MLRVVDLLSFVVVLVAGRFVFVLSVYCVVICYYFYLSRIFCYYFIIRLFIRVFNLVVAPNPGYDCLFIMFKKIMTDAQYLSILITVYEMTVLGRCYRLSVGHSVNI